MAGERGGRGREQGLQEGHKEKQCGHDPSHPGGVWESTGPFSFLIGPLLIQYLWVYFYFFIMSEDILEIEQKPTKKFYSKKKKMGR